MAGKACSEVATVEVAEASAEGLACDEGEGDSGTAPPREQ